MNTGAGLPILGKSGLFERLAQGRASGVAVVTPNQRLAAALARDFDSHQVARGLASWESADVLPFSAFVERLYQDALYSELATGLPVLLSGAQEQALWEAIIRGSEAGKMLLSVRGAAKLAADAWRLAHEWKLSPRLKEFPANDDPRIFSGWAWRYQGTTASDGCTERARLPEIVAGHLGHAAIRIPKTVVAYGFDVLTPQQREVFGKLEAAGTVLWASGPEARVSESRRVALPSARDEIHAAARWARARLEADPGARIGVVVPSLGKARSAVRRIFSQTLGPAPVLPFDISLGEPLASLPLVAAALLVLEIARGEFDFSVASRLLRSPFIEGAEAERAARAQLDAALRRDCASRLDLASLRRAIERAASDTRYGAPACPILSRRLADLARWETDLSGAKRPSEWARAISALLDTAGFPGERDPDSSEYQALKKLHDAVADFAMLDRVAGRMRFEEAREGIRGAFSEILFQPEAPDVPVQVLGVLESAGMEFDYLWVMGLTDDAWPIPAHPNPFVPVALQRAAGVPESSAASALELDRRITLGWLSAAREVVFSHALREEDRDLVASPLIRDVQEVPPEALSFSPCESFRDLIRRARREVRTADGRGPALRSPSPGATVPGGTGIFRDQAACPFRAFARHRLGAKGLDAPPAGLDARDRGILVHEMLKAVWTELASKSRLDSLKASERDALLEKAATEALSRLRRTAPGAIGSRLARLEKGRLVALAREWLDLEKRRPDFEISELEAKRQVSFGGVTVNARLDRSDRLAGGARAIIDYKTGDAKIGAWLGERPDEPQLPIYAVATGEEVAAVAFACVRTGEKKPFRGIAKKDGLIPGVNTLGDTKVKGARGYASWKALLQDWRKELEALGSGFAAGDARVDPKQKAKLETCRTCDVQSFCRIYERYGAPIDDDGGRSKEQPE